MRIVTRADFDSVTCAVLLYEALDIREPVKWAEPSEMQKGLINVLENDIIANLPYHENCMMWFDHHYTNRIDTPFKGSFKIAPSAAGIIFEYYKDRFKRDYTELVRETDRIDSADLTLDEVLHPENYPYILLSMTISSHKKSDETYWNRLVSLLRTYKIDTVIEDPEVRERCNIVIKQNKAYKVLLQEHTRVMGHVSVTDFRSFNEEAPVGNRFLVYSLFPEAVVSLRIRYDSEDREKVIVGVGHSIFNRNCNVNVGVMLSEFEGGGHRGAGACRFHASKADDYIPRIIDILLKNESNET
ncbi:exopolyphosphatase [Desulfococcaceae bacterium HSG8]|nr:exopolyphosphatase [Desulfococcaceae bacterium HSG8]